MVSKKTKSKKKKKRFNLLEEYKDSWNYIKQSKDFIYVIVAVFFIFMLIGFFLPAPESIANQLLDFLKKLVAETQNLSMAGLIRFIFLNNVQSSFFSMIFGIFLGIFPVVAAIINGYLLGFVSAMSVQSEGISILLRLLPHGIFELPAIFISLGLGLKFGTFIFQKKKIEFFKKYLFSSLKVFFLIIVPLLIVAGIIEGSFIFLLK